MPRSSIFTKKATSYKDRKLKAAATAVAAARGSYLTSRRIMSTPFRSGGFGPNFGRGLAEMKTIDVTTTAGATAAIAGNVFLLNGVAEGNDYNTRNARKIVMKSLLFRFDVDNGSGVQNGVLGDSIRFIVFYDKQSNGAAPTVANLLQNADWMSPNNLDNRDRFVVLMDKNTDIPAWSNSAGAVLLAGSPGPKTRKFYRKLNLEAIFKGTGATIGDISTGSIYLCVIGANGTGTFYYNSRIRFLDP